MQCICILFSYAWCIDTSTLQVLVAEICIMVCYNHKVFYLLNMYIQVLKHHLLTSQFFLMFASKSFVKAIYSRYGPLGDMRTPQQKRKKNTIYCCLLPASWVFSHNEKKEEAMYKTHFYIPNNHHSPHE